MVTKRKTQICQFTAKSKKKKRIMKGPPLPGNIDPGRKGGVHPIMAHMGRLRSKGVPFQASAI